MVDSWLQLDVKGEFEVVQGVALTFLGGLGRELGRGGRGVI